MSKTKAPRRKFIPSTAIFDETVRRFTAAPSFDGLLLQIAKGYTPRLLVREARRVTMEESRAAGYTEEAAAHQAAAAGNALEAMGRTLLSMGFAYIDDDGNCRR